LKKTIYGKEVVFFEFNCCYRLLSYGFKPLKVESNEWFLIKNTDGSILISVSNKENYTDLNIPFTGNLFVGFKQALGFKESKNKYQKINSLGYLGKYQFGTETLKVGIHNPQLFLRSPRMQEKLLLHYYLRTKPYLKMSSRDMTVK
jgi:hypothetical protein